MNQSITKSIDILKLFITNRTLSVTEVSNQLNEHKSKISRIMKTMATNDLLCQDAKSKLYSLGPIVLKLAYSSIGDVDIRRFAYPFMKKLNEVCNESILLSVLSGDEVIQVDQIASKHSLMVFSEIGKTFSLYTGALLNTTTGASARAIAAYMPWDDVKNRLMKDERYKRYKGKPDLLKIERYSEELKSIRETGYAVARCEINKGVIAISSPILNAMNNPIASITVIGPDIRLDKAAILETGEKLKEITTECAYAMRTYKQE